MNSPSNAVFESHAGSQAMAPAEISAMRIFYWSIRRELWEYRSIYIAPLGVAAVFLLAFAIAYPLHHRHQALAMPYEISAALIMGTALLVGLYYAVDALYSERRDRSILFWKSLPVSDLTAVLSKLTIPLVIVPLLSFAITIVTQFLMLLLSSGVRLVSGLSVAELWSQPAPFLQISLMLLYHIVLVHGLWYAPLYGWLLLVSAWAPRAPLIWAVLPGVVIYGVEKIAFNTSHFLVLLQERLLGPSSHGATAPDKTPMAEQLIPHHFFSEPGLWIGLLVGAVFIAGAVRLRRYRGPI
jgi:ABC-2 type transport system permease protein